ncbi:hypothetical protein NQ314_001233 [Rhamnusium bicolor]|uniref:Dual oxidase maturation factor 1 n=1 Tax=Rhamnusium bicolor TaxID=1586634 RepID=A0AAV8ZSR8_9CUCU|nr:hypothetical protein NQ314_001233 [Rhamnusium bicolor]
MWFDLARSDHFPTQYGPNATPVTVDVLEAGLITAFLILGVSFLVSLPTTRLKTVKSNNICESFDHFINRSPTFSVCSFNCDPVFLKLKKLIPVNNFGQEWEVGHIQSKTAYKAGTGAEINASISIKIALRGVNVTLKSNPGPDSDLKYEIIDYNERFEWTWDQGRFGFGPFAGHLQQQFRAAQYRGLPLPILWIMDYFVIDGEGFRFGRFYRTAGWYTHIIMWTAFACWLLANILFTSVINYGAYFLGICGALQLVANLVWLVVRNPNPLVIPFEDGDMVTKYGFNYWATFVMGLLCLLLSAVILYMDYKYDQELYNLFGVNPLDSYDEVAYLTKEERMQLRPKNATSVPTDIPLVEISNDPEEEEEDVDYVPVYLKRKTIAMAPKVIRSNKPRHLYPLPVPDQSIA